MNYISSISIFNSIQIKRPIWQWIAMYYQFHKKKHAHLNQLVPMYIPIQWKQIGPFEYEFLCSFSMNTNRSIWKNYFLFDPIPYKQTHPFESINYYQCIPISCKQTNLFESITFTMFQFHANKQSMWINYFFCSQFYANE